MLYECLVRRVPTRSAPFYLERGSTNHLDRSTEKSSACAIAPDLLEQNILMVKRYVAQNKDDVGWRENNMTQITSIKLGLIAICFATVPLSLAQTPRTGTSGSNQTGAITPATAGHSGLSGNSTSAAQLNSRSSTITAPNTNAGAHTAAAAAAPASVNSIQPPLIPVPIRSPLPNNSPVGSNFSTAGESPSLLPSASVTPTPTPTPAQLL